MFSFGFGKKKQPEPETEEQPSVDEEAVARAQAEKADAERLAAERAAAEEAARLEAERQVAEREAAAKKAAEEEAALRKAREEAEKRKAEREAAAKALEEQKRQEAEAAKRKEAEAKAAKEAEKKRQEEEKASAAKAKAEADNAAKLEAEKAKAAKEAEVRRAAEAAEAKRAEAERLAAEKEAAELAKKEEVARKEAERLAAEAEEAKAEAARVEAERLAAEEEERKKAQQRADEERARAEAEKLSVDASAEAGSESDEEDAERKEGWFKRLRKGLSRSSSTLKENITGVFTKKKLDEDTLQDLEDILIQADLGVETAMNVTDALSDQRYGKDVTDEEVREIMAEEIRKVLEPVAQPLELDLEHQPHVILVVGVNGSGKTTTIGKLSQKLYNAGFSTLLVAGDTFRAAAVEQLHIWGERTQAPVMSRANGADAAGLAFDAYAEAQAQKKDVMLMDTAGRLQNKKELMDELEKIIRVLKKQDPHAPHTVLLTLDATTGQNALNQVEIFKDVAGVNGLVMTKLDGTARGGILVAISAKHKLPVYFIGVGEQVEDLEPFEADVFANAIAGLDSEADE